MEHKINKCKTGKEQNREVDHFKKQFKTNRTEKLVMVAIVDFVVNQILVPIKNLRVQVQT